MSDNLTPEKAKMIIRDRKVRNHPLSKAQMRYFGLIAGGGKSIKKKNKKEKKYG